MKDSNRTPVRPATPAPNIELDAIKAILEPELLQIAAGWSAAKRLAVAKEFQRWAHQLNESAGVVNPPPKISKGFVMVNLDTWQQKELRELARESGQELRGMLRHALTLVYEQLKETVRVKRVTGLNGLEQHRFFSPGAGEN